jgi:hypothetical protein
MKFDGIIFAPKGPDALKIQELVLSEAEEQSLYRSFSGALRPGKGFVISLKIPGDDRDTAIRFTHIGKTAAYYMLSHDVNGQPQHIHGVTALLSKMDAEEDRRAITDVRKFAVLKSVDNDVFEAALANKNAVSATFFADSASANYPPLHTVIRILGAAFFEHFSVPSANLHA